MSRILTNPTSEFMLQTCLCGERATWPRLSRIKNRCAVELELDSAVQTLRTRVVFSPSQVDLRRMATLNYSQPVKRNTRRRRDSGSNIQSPTNGDEESSPASRKSSTRPPLRTTNSHWLIRQHMTSLAPSGFTSSPASPLESRPPNNNLQVPDTSSAGETTFSAPSSDADVDSHTDDSSAEPDIADQVAARLRAAKLIKGFRSESPFDLFSNSQPVTSDADRVMATSPFRALSDPFNIPTLSKFAGAGLKNPSEPSTPTSIPSNLILTPGPEGAKS